LVLRTFKAKVISFDRGTGKVDGHSVGCIDVRGIFDNDSFSLAFLASHPSGGPLRPKTRGES